MSEIVDVRANKQAPGYGYIVCTDSCLSGWGGAEGGRSLYALALDDYMDYKAVMNNADARTDMKRPRHITSFTAEGLPKIKLGANDHLKVVDKGEAANWYKDGYFIQH